MLKCPVYGYFNVLAHIKLKAGTHYAYTLMKGNDARGIIPCGLFSFSTLENIFVNVLILNGLKGAQTWQLRAK
jgi:hypothetical protein